jgi:hypothetical protein
VDERCEAALLRKAFKLQEAALIATVFDGSPEPKIYKEAKQCTNFPNWWGAMCIEFNNMEQKKVWEIIPKTKVPAGRKFIGGCWVIERKDDGLY